MQGASQYECYRWNCCSENTYSGDIYFMVVDIRGETAILKGYIIVLADAPLDDLIQVPDEKSSSSWSD